MGRDAIMSVGAVGLSIYGAVLFAPILPALIGIVAVGGAMVWFSGVNHKDHLEDLERKRKNKSIDADEIIPPSRKRRQSHSNETVTIGRDAELERQIHAAQLKEARLKEQLAQTRSAINTMKFRDYTDENPAD